MIRLIVAAIRWLIARIFCTPPSPPRLEPIRKSERARAKAEARREERSDRDLTDADIEELDVELDDLRRRL